MDFSFSCPCGQALVTSVEKRGTVVKCPTCSATVMVPAAAPAAPASAKQTGSALTAKVITRYRDGYAVAGTLCAEGAQMKRLGFFAIVGGLVSYLYGLWYGPDRVGVAISLAAVGLGAFMVALGVFVSALGQMVRAALDSAVHGSPFLSEADKAKAMGL